MDQNQQIGLLKSAQGIVLKKDSSGNESVIKQGAFLQDGDALVLLSGNATIQMLKGFPQALSLERVVNLDGISPLLKNDGQSLVEQIVEEAMLAGIDPTLVLDKLEATAAGEHGAKGEGGQFVALTPLYSLGQVAVDYITGNFSVVAEGFTKEVRFYQDNGDEFIEPVVIGR